MNNKELAAMLLIEAAEILKNVSNDKLKTLEEGAVKTSKKHKLDNYLKKYNYKGDNKSGTITVDGEEYEVDRCTDSPFVTLPSGEKSIRQGTTAYTATKNKISLGNEFNKLKNNKRRDAILQHEIGHHKNHNLANGKITEDHLDAVYDSIAKNIHYSKPQISTTSIKHNLMNRNDSCKKRSDYTENDKRRVSNLEKFKKYETNTPHTDRVEYEADAYAQSHKNGNHLKRALRESNKHNNTEKSIMKNFKAKNIIRKDNEMEPDVITNDDIKNTLKLQRRITDIDYKQRSKALNDKSIDRNAYTERDE